MLIRQGGFCGIIRNSLILILGNALIEEAGNLGQLHDDWKNMIQNVMLPVANDNIPQYYCLTCTMAAAI